MKKYAIIKIPPFYFRLFVNSRQILEVANIENESYSYCLFATCNP